MQVSPEAKHQANVPHIIETISGLECKSLRVAKDLHDRRSNHNRKREIQPGIFCKLRPDDGSSGGPETALFSGVFNGLGVLPAVFASLLCGGGAFAKGRQPVPPQPFVFGAFGLGFFALAPYLALRNYLPEMEEGEDPTFLEVRVECAAVVC